MNKEQSEPIESGWFDKKENVRKVLVSLFGACAFLVVLDLVFWFLHFDKHPYFKWEQWPGFYTIFGFVSCVVLVLIAKFLLRPLVKRSENYYERTKKEGEDNV